MLARILAMIRKEFIQMRRDKGTIVIALMIPIIQLTLYGYAINTDIKHVPIGILDYSHTPESRDLIQAFTQTQYFTLEARAENSDELTAMIDQGKVRVGLAIDVDYAKDLHRSSPAKLQVLVDASDPQVAASTLSNANGIAQTRSLSILARRVHLSGDKMPVDVQIRAWYNPDLVTAYHIVPGLIGVILTMTMTNITAMAIVKEREMGTMEQLITTPLRPVEIVIGKIVPYILVGYAQVTVALLLGILLFHVPIRGSLPLLYTLCFLQVLSYLCWVADLNGGQIATASQSDGISDLSPQHASGRLHVPPRGHACVGSDPGPMSTSYLFFENRARHHNERAGIQHLMHEVVPMLIIMVIVVALAIRRLKQSPLT